MGSRDSSVSLDYRSGIREVPLSLSLRPRRCRLVFSSPQNLRVGEPPLTSATVPQQHLRVHSAVIPTPSFPRSVLTFSSDSCPAP